MPNLIRKNVKILIVDDSIINQEIASDFIEDLGFDFDTANNGLQALEAIKINNYSLVFMDIHMPVMDGLTATEAVREHEKEHHGEPVPIIALTSDASTGIKQRCLNAGMNDYLVKPFTQQELVETISKNINHRLTDNITVLTGRPHSQVPVVDIKDDDNALLDVVEDIAQVSHWFWHITDQKIQFSKYLQHHFDFPLKNISTLDEYIKKVGSNNMDSVINECISTEQETHWEQIITEPGSEQQKYILHKFRYVICEDDNPVLIGTIQDISSIRHAELEVMEMASNDAITGLRSRFMFNQQLEDLIKYSQRHSKKFALLYLNFDTYKTISDSHGHEEGKQVLIEITSRLQTILRKSDFACRLIDDEFCLAIKDIDDDFLAMKIAERYLKLFHKPIQVANKTITPNTNIGLSIYPQDGSKATDLIRAANTATIKAKHTNNNHCAFFENSMTSAAHHRKLKEIELRAALDENQFELYYQPKVSLHDGKVESVEAFIRWNNPDQNLHLPESFLPDAERMGLMDDIGHWVLKQVCTQINQWKQQGLEDIRVSVNIAQHYFEQIYFVDEIFQIVSEANISPALIEIEITECISRNHKVFTKTCNKLRDLGFTTAIDDFGTGYSSLSALKEIPIDVLKIDHEFIRNLPNDTQSSIIIGTILGISNALGLQVVAEGVENNEQLKTLVAMGCHMAQGFYFSHPVPAAEIPAMSKQNFRKPDFYRVA